MKNIGAYGPSPARDNNIKYRVGRGLPVHRSGPYEGCFLGSYIVDHSPIEQDEHQLRQLVLKNVGQRLGWSKLV